MVEWYDTPNGEAATPVYEYLLFNARDVAVEGLDFRGYGRLGTDPQGEADAESRLYYAYFQKKDALPNTDVKVGRQFIASAAGAALVDGMDFLWKQNDGFWLELFGGGDVSINDDYEWGDFMGGVELGTSHFDRLDLAASLVRVWDDGDVARDLFGIYAEYRIPNTMNLYSELQYNFLNEAVTYFVGGFKYYRSSAWSLRSQYLYSMPVFDATSIYSVFAVAEYQEVMGELNFNLAKAHRAYLRLTHEIYKEFSDADVVELGFEKIRTSNFFGYVAGTWRDDEDGQDLWGIKARLAYNTGKNHQVGIGLHHDVLERRNEEEDETTSQRIWLDGIYSISNRINCEGKIERAESDLYDDYYSGRLRLKITF